MTITTMRDDMVSDVRLTLYLLLGAVCLVLLIACSNVATLLLSKATVRTREIAIRAAVGAGRGRIIRQLITESLVLAVLAGAAGLMLAVAGSKALIALAPPDVPRLAEAGIDGRVLAFTLGVSVVCSLLFGIVPALYASRIDLNDALKRGGARAVTGGGSTRLRPALVIAEIALSVMLLAGAGLLIKSLVAVTNVALGFHPERALLMKTSLPASGPEGEARARRFFKQLLSEIAVIPGVSGAGATMGPPGDVESAGSYWIDHSREMAVGFTPEKDAVYSVVTPGTFAALGIPLKRGRDFEDRDAANAPLTAVINETLAKALPGQDPIGHIIFTGFDSNASMEASLYEETAAPRFRTLLLGIFAGLSLCLAIAGVYGVTAYVVGQRSNEIGLRMAMGATPGHVLRLILRHGMVVGAVGVAFGLVGSWVGTRLMTSMLFEVRPSDPVTYAGVAVLLGFVVLLASYFPARRAAKVDPLVALRQE